uniref:Uncharacterized protein n=1 Tax=Plectus sambesii TaxID=2011161 RepID=A0A914W9S6_9BILA
MRAKPNAPSHWCQWNEHRRSLHYTPRLTPLLVLHSPSIAPSRRPTRRELLRRRTAAADARLNSLAIFILRRKDNPKRPTAVDRRAEVQTSSSNAQSHKNTAQHIDDDANCCCCCGLRTAGENNACRRSVCDQWRGDRPASADYERSIADGPTVALCGAPARRPSSASQPARPPRPNRIHLRSSTKKRAVPSIFTAAVNLWERTLTRHEQRTTSATVQPQQ